MGVIPQNFSYKLLWRSISHALYDFGLNIYTLEKSLDLNPISHVGYLSILATKSTGGSSVDLDIKSKLVNLIADTLEASSKLNPISHGSHLTLS